MKDKFKIKSEDIYLIIFIHTLGISDVIRSVDKGIDKCRDELSEINTIVTDILKYE